MNILFVTPSYKPAYIYGGPVVAVSLLAERLVRLGHQVTVFTTTANGKDELNVEPGKEQLVDGVKVFYFRRLTKDHTHISIDLWWHLSRNVKQFDVVHINSWWNFAILGAAWICRQNRVIPGLSPRGMFSSFILNRRNKRKKQFIQRIIGRTLLKNTFLHVSTKWEWEESKKINPGWEGRIIPNLVKLTDILYPHPADHATFQIGFLSRIHPKKGLDLLIEALGRVDFPYKLLIAGDGDESYINSLKQIAADCGTSGNIEWVGWKEGEEKFEFLSQLDLFALTSHSENFAIVVIESLSVGTPVLISDQIGLYKYVVQNDVGWVCDLDVKNITDQLNNIYRDKEKLKKINASAPALITEDYEETKLANQYVQFYEDVRSKDLDGTTGTRKIV